MIYHVATATTTTTTRNATKARQCLMHPIQIQTNMDLCENCQIDIIGGSPDGSDKKDKSRSADALASALPVPPKKLSEILEKKCFNF